MLARPLDKRRSRQPAKDGECDGYYVGPALIVREDHLDEEDPNCEPDDRSHDGSKNHHRPS